MGPQASRQGASCLEVGGALGLGGQGIHGAGRPGMERTVKEMGKGQMQGRAFGFPG